MGVHMELVLEAAILSCVCLENLPYSRGGVCTEDDVELLRIGVEKAEHVVWCQMSSILPVAR